MKILIVLYSNAIDTSSTFSTCYDVYHSLVYHGIGNNHTNTEGKSPATTDIALESEDIQPSNFAAVVVRNAVYSPVEVYNQMISLVTTMT